MADETKGQRTPGGRPNTPGGRRPDRNGGRSGGGPRRSAGRGKDARPAASKASPARVFALQVGKAVREREAFTHDVIEAQLPEARLSEEDKAFATKLALGVTMSAGTLDELIDHACTNPKALMPEVRDALRVSAYEIIFLDKSPHAAVDQGVELVRSVEPRAAGLANAVLRKLVDARRTFPFGNPDVSLVALARKNAFPVWMAKSVLDDRGKDELKAFLEASNEVAPLYVAENALRAEAGEVQAAFGGAQAEAEPVTVDGRAIPRCWKVGNHRAIARPEVAALLKGGKAIVSDASAQAIARLAVPRTMPGRFLEVGAGRGTKSILLQNVAFERFGAQMPLETVDNLPFKAKIQEKRAALTGVRLDEAHVLDAQRLRAKFGDEAFDAVFVDAPCSGLGTLRRHPEIRWRITPRDIESLARLNAVILQEAAYCTKVGGLLTYATCTITKAENELVVERFLRSSIGERFKIVPLGDAAAAKAPGASRQDAAKALFFASNLRSDGPDAHFAAQFVRVR